MIEPVCPCCLTLYGHLDSGAEWEKHARALMSLPKVFVLGTIGLHVIAIHNTSGFLVIHVDDFKMAGPKDKPHPGWDPMRGDSPITKGFNVESLGPLRLFFGCKHEQSERAPRYFEEGPGDGV